MSALQTLAVQALENGPTELLEYEGRWFSAADLARVAAQVRALIAASGAVQDAPVAFVPRNRPAAVATLLGLIADGRTIQMIYAFQSGAGVARDIARLKPAVVVLGVEDLSDDVRRVLREEGLAAVCLDGMEARAAEGFEETGRARGRPAGEAPRIEILTSGTTGPPKQFPITYEMISRHMIGLNVVSADPADLSSAPPVILLMPLGNISGIYSTLPPLLQGRRTVLLDRFSVEEWRDYIVRHRPQVTGLPPAGVQMVLDAQLPREDLASVRYLGTGAAPLDPTVHRAFEAHYGIPILLSYGATEFGGPVAAMTTELHARWGAAKFGSVGRAMPGARLRVVDPETGAELPAGREGVLEVVSPRIGPDWIRTSDLAAIDEDGFLFHRGRLDGAIMRGGFKLLPETIERALMLHPSVSAAGVVGVPDRRLGQVPAAAVQFKPEAPPASVAELEAHLREQVPATHLPVHWRVVEDLPKTPSFKIDRPGLRCLFSDLVAEP